MKEYKRILDYVIEQANRNDGHNLQFEQDILFNIDRARNKTFDRMIARGSGCMNLTQMNELLQVLQTMMGIYIRDAQKELRDKFMAHFTAGYRNTDQLFDVGLDIEKRFSRRVTEISLPRDETTIDYIQEHAFDMLTGYGEGIINQLRSALGDLILKGNADRAAVQGMIERVLHTNASKAREIAQTELSRAYNYGVLARLEEYQLLTGEPVRKYWHGFQYSPRTCTYCLERIGNIYDLNDDSETLPAHPRCRCVWLPVLNGWDQPLDRSLIVRANMLNTGYSEEQIYSRINSRLGINYGEYLKIEDAVEYLEGDRTPAMISKIGIARQQAIDTAKDQLQIPNEQGTDVWSKKFNQQMGFWRTQVAEAMIDNDKLMLSKCYDAIKTVMVLPWSGGQLAKWETLLETVDKARI